MSKIWVIFRGCWGERISRSALWVEIRYNVIGLDASSSSPCFSSAHSRCEKLFVRLSPASSYLVTQDWCNRMQSGSLARSLPPSSYLPFLLSTHSSLPFSVADHHSRSLSLYPSICLIVQSSLSFSLARSHFLSRPGTLSAWLRMLCSGGPSQLNQIRPIRC